MNGNNLSRTDTDHVRSRSQPRLWSAESHAGNCHPRSTILISFWLQITLGAGPMGWGWGHFSAGSLERGAFVDIRYHFKISRKVYICTVPACCCVCDLAPGPASPPQHWPGLVRLFHHVGLIGTWLCTTWRNNTHSSSSTDPSGVTRILGIWADLRVRSQSAKRGEVFRWYWPWYWHNSEPDITNPLLSAHTGILSRVLSISNLQFHYSLYFKINGL